MSLATIRLYENIKSTLQRYLFLGSTRYYTIFWVLIRLSHDTFDIIHYKLASFGAISSQEAILLDHHDDSFKTTPCGSKFDSKGQLAADIYKKYWIDRNWLKTNQLLCKQVCNCTMSWRFGFQRQIFYGMFLIMSIHVYF